MVNMLLGILTEMWCVQYMHTRLLVTKCIVGRGVYVYPKPTEILDFKAVPYDYQLHLGTQKPLPLIENELWCLLASSHLVSCSQGWMDTILSMMLLNY